MSARCLGSLSFNARIRQRCALLCGEDAAKLFSVCGANKIIKDVWRNHKRQAEFVPTVASNVESVQTIKVHKPVSVVDQGAFPLNVALLGRQWPRCFGNDYPRATYTEVCTLDDGGFSAFDIDFEKMHIAGHVLTPNPS